MLFITEEEVRHLLPMQEAVRLMREAFEQLGRGEAQNQSRRRLILPTGSVLHSLAGATPKYFGTKFYATNRKHGANFLFALYESETAKPLALMEANYLGQIRTGAASGYATDLLARRDASVLGIIGSGFQARTQVHAIRTVRPIKAIRVWSRDPEKCRQFAEEVGATATNTAEETVRGADIVATATSSKDPVVESTWIEDGVHVNAMGSNIADRRELPPELLRRAAVIAVDSLEQAKQEAGDLILASQWSNVVELKTAPVRDDERAVTIFKSIGIGLEDVAAGAYVYEQALSGHVGHPLPS